MGPKGNNKIRGKNSKDDQKISLEVIQRLKGLLKVYERECTLANSFLDANVKETLKKHITDGKPVIRFFLQGDTSPNEDINQRKKIPPLLKSLRENWYKPLKELYFWKMEILREDIYEIKEYFEQPSYSVEYLELLDCKIESHSLLEFSKCFSVNHSLTTLVLDYTDLQEEGMNALYKGLVGTKSIFKLSLCYCRLSPQCGELLGKLVVESTISELYADGNSLECHGLINIIHRIVDHAEFEQIEEEKERRRKEQELLNPTPDQIKQNISAVNTYSSQAPPQTTKSVSNSSLKSANITKMKSKKKKRGKKSAKRKLPPKSGPCLTILHIADNGIDGMDSMDREIEGNLFPETMQLMSRWIRASKDLKEIDLEDNLIGELGGLELLTALQKRKEAGLKSIYLKVTHRISTPYFKQIIKIASGSSKRGGKKKKRKKGTGPKRKI